jgi:uncharacterized membrane protein
MADDLSRQTATLVSVACAVAVALPSAEVYLHFRQTVEDLDRARWLAQAGLTIVWSVSAAVLVGVGFWRRVRGLRFAGLGLFAVVAAKLLLVDTAQVEGGYRVASLMVVGALMIGASYLYHRVERWMSATRA